jgi:hypothetical protein
MIIQKKITIFLLFISAAGLILLMPNIAQADYATDLNKQLGATVGNKGADIAESKDPRLVAALVIKTALQLMGTAFLAYAVYAGFLIMTAAGNEEQITQGKSIINRAAIGIIVILSAYSITVFVTTKFIPLEDSQQSQDDSFEQQDAVDRAQQQLLNQDPLNQDINKFRP